jgi:hypothetical protein
MWRPPNLTYSGQFTSLRTWHSLVSINNFSCYAGNVQAQRRWRAHPTRLHALSDSVQSYTCYPSNI